MVNPFEATTFDAGADHSDVSRHVSTRTCPIPDRRIPDDPRTRQ